MKIINFNIFSNTGRRKNKRCLLIILPVQGQIPCMNTYINVSKKTFFPGKSKQERNCRPSGCLQKILGISVITVENAYGQLMAEGYIYSHA